MPFKTLEDKNVSGENHASLTNLAWVSSAHNGTSSTIAGFAASTGVASEYTLSGTGTVLPTTASPTFTGTITDGSTTTGANHIINATEGAELMPSLATPNWTLGTGWETPIAGGVLNKNAAGTGTATPSGATAIVAGTTYKVVITVSGLSGAEFLFYYLGSTQVRIIADGTYTHYVTTSTTNNLIIDPFSSASTFVVSSISVKALTDNTGDLTVYGNLKLASPIQNSSGQNIITFGATGNVGLGDTDIGAKLTIGDNQGNAIAIYEGNGNGVAIRGLSSRGTTLNPTQILANDGLMGLRGAGYTDANTWANAKAQINFYAAENFTATANGTYITLATTPIGGTGATERMRIADTGTVNITNTLTYTNNAITVSSNAATVPVTSKLNTITNNAAGAVVITMTTTGAVDGQITLVRFYDYSGVAQNLTFVNTENSLVSVPTTSKGSTTIPTIMEFIYNGATSKHTIIKLA